MRGRSASWPASPRRSSPRRRRRGFLVAGGAGTAPGGGGARRSPAAESVEALEAIRVRYLGRKGSLNAVLRGLGQLPPEERPAMGALANTVKDEVSSALDAQGRGARAEAGLARALDEERIDVTLPGAPPPARAPPPAARRPRTSSSTSSCRWASPSPRVPRSRTTSTTSEALNFPPDHPARDAQDTFFLAGRATCSCARTPRPTQLHVMRSTAAAHPRGDARARATAATIRIRRTRRCSSRSRA